MRVGQARTGAVVVVVCAAIAMLIAIPDSAHAQGWVEFKSTPFVSKSQPRAFLIKLVTRHSVKVRLVNEFSMPVKAVVHMELVYRVQGVQKSHFVKRRISAGGKQTRSEVFSVAFTQSFGQLIRHSITLATIDYTDPKKIVRRANQSYAAGQYRAAIRLYEKAIRAGASRATIDRAIGGVYQGWVKNVRFRVTNEPTKSLRTCLEVRAKRPRTPGVRQCIDEARRAGAKAPVNVATKTPAITLTASGPSGQDKERMRKRREFQREVAENNRKLKNALARLRSEQKHKEHAEKVDRLFRMVDPVGHAERKLQKAISDLATAIAKSKNADEIVGGMTMIGMIAVPLMSARYLPNPSTGDSPVGFVEVFAPTMTVGLPTAAAVYFALVAGKGMRNARIDKGTTIMEALTDECSQGIMASCRDARSVADRVADLERGALSRRFSSPLFGPGGWRGPAFEWRSTVGYLADTIDDPTSGYVGETSGVAAQFVVRRRWLRASFTYGSRFGDLLGDGTDYGIASAGFGAGLQFGQGLLSPYAELRTRVHGRTNSYGNELGDDASQDNAVVVGNTFNLSGLWSTSGPLNNSLVIDVSRTLSTGPTYGDSWSVALGWTMTVTDSPKRQESGPPPAISTDGVMAYAHPSGAGLTFARWNGLSKSTFGSKADSPGISLSAVDVWAGFDGGLNKLGMSIFAIGPRFRFDGGSLEVGAQFGGLAGEGYDLAEDGKFGLGFVPTKIYARTKLAGFPIEVGVHMPLIWMSLTENADGDNDVSLFDGFPAFVYIGLGL